MESQRRQKLVLVDGYTRFCLTAIAVLLTVLIIGLWADGVGLARNAGAAEQRYVPKSTLEITDMVRNQEQTNEKLDQIIRLLESGTAKVQVVQAPAAPSGGQQGDVQPTQTQQTTE